MDYRMAIDEALGCARQHAIPMVVYYDRTEEFEIDPARLFDYCPSGSALDHLVVGDDRVARIEEDGSIAFAALAKLSPEAATARRLAVLQGAVDDMLDAVMRPGGTIHNVPRKLWTALREARAQGGGR